MAIAYTRNAAYVKERLVQQDDGSVTTKAACRILVPERYANRHLATLGNQVYILGFFVLIMDEKHYAVSRTCASIRITPSSSDRIDMEGMSFLEFSFFPGDQLFYSTELVKNDTLTYYIYDEHVAKGNIPWYFNYFDIAKFFETAGEFAGFNLGSKIVMELILSTMCRDEKDLTRLYRHVIENEADVVDKPPVLIPFKSVIWNVTDTTSKIIGAYYGDSIASALVNPNEQVERIEELLRT